MYLDAPARKSSGMMWMFNYILRWFQSLILRIVKTGQMPRHVALIMDGNRRYANKRNLAKGEGHSRGFDKLIETLNWCMDLGITEVTVYAFSIENFQRTEEEVDELMKLAKQKFRRLLDEREKLHEAGLCIRVIGNLSLLPKDLCKLIAETIVITKDNNKAILNLAFPYTSRDEVTSAIKDIGRGVKRAEILPEDVDEDLVSDCLYFNRSPNPDLLIRTSGETRLSDFLMWQIADTYIYFTDVLWPEFSIWNFLGAIFNYQRCYPELQKNKKTKPIVRNNRVSTFLDKLQRERDIAIHNMYVSDLPD
ncbi:PREDICTED: dehydrodolichyl diphosphate syntase complex subunit DHDDS-like isoform X1 [Vollenhovia emeryi]|uniref:dehydrodolichyl diphosphate syntase complex subunit DHDDS-like isoform X1 n=2 Tax=Vollenhovia emeryi TaxID=411798 RepID=UPI0005F4C9C4|nr:PREDICTED: dehydrodolichyl diphosphate syntase complex subunit DHDDS-like isoform X1 [Vollenhovia emeryi]